MAISQTTFLQIFTFLFRSKKKAIMKDMTSLTVIALVVRLRITTHTIQGDATYRDKSTDETQTFGFKQFLNARHEHNEAFKEGNLVLLGGKFTIDDQKKLLVSVTFIW